MDCKRVEQLLPLHAGGDLEDVRERAPLAAHLEGCADCRRAAEDWAEAVGLLRAGDAPEFDAAFFDPIRREVMREITAATTTRPATNALTTFTALFAQLLRPRPLAFAASLALVCTALFFALRLSRAPRPSKPAGGGVASSVNRQFSPVPEPSKGARPDTVANKDERRKTSAPALQVRGDRTPPRESTGARESAVAKQTTRRVEDEGPSSPSPASVAPPQTVAAVAETALPNANAELAVVKDERVMLKIDLRTSDPDVRIIWFSPQPNEQTSPRTTNDKR